MEAELVRLSFKEGGKDAWLEWCRNLKNRKGEVLDTLKMKAYH